MDGDAFSLDLDISLSDLTGQPKPVEPGVLKECVEESEINSRNEPESTETTDSELQVTCENSEETERDKTLNEDISLHQEDTDFDTKTRPQRLKRAPLRLTYCTPRHPSVLAAPIVKYVS